jgi:hypothetical protein
MPAGAEFEPIFGDYLTFNAKPMILKSVRSKDVSMG